MECLHPIVVKSTDGLSNYRLVPCGKCIACRARKASSWSLRVQNEASDSNSCYFITLTYTDDNLTYGDSLNATLVPSDLSGFIKRYRKYLTSHYDDKHSVRFFAAGEYGDRFGRPHYHLMLFYPFQISTEDVRKGVQACWHYNDPLLQPIDVQDFSVPLANYITKYCLKQIGFDYEGVCPPFARMSRRPGIGANHYSVAIREVIRSSGQHFLYDAQQHRISMPRYYRPFFYSDDEQSAYSYSIERKLFISEDTSVKMRGLRYFSDVISSHMMYEYNYFRDFRCDGFKRVSPDISVSRSVGHRYISSYIEPDGSF